MLFVYRNSVCQKCFDLVSRSNQKLRKILKRLGVETKRKLLRVPPREREIAMSSSLPRCIDYVIVGRSSAFVRSRSVIKIHGCNALFESKIDAEERNEIKEKTFWSLSKISRGSFRLRRESFIFHEASRPHRGAGRSVISGIVCCCRVYVRGPAFQRSPG